MRFKIEVLKKGRQWFWRIRAGNGKILAHSETYSSKTEAVTMAQKLTDSVLVVVPS